MLVLALLLMPFVVGGCTDEGAERSSLEKISQAVRISESLTVYEGLPHQTWEAEALAREKKTKKTVQIGGFPFYQELLEISPADQAKLKEICSSPGAFTPWAGAKACGGFHPDYCLVWKKGEQTCALLICFGCGEMMAVADRRVEVSDMAVESELRAILENYRKNRPDERH